MKKLHVGLVAACALLIYSVAVVSSALALESGILASAVNPGKEVLIIYECNLTPVDENLCPLVLLSDLGTLIVSDVECEVALTVQHVLANEIKHVITLEVLLVGCLPASGSNGCSSVDKNAEAVNLPWLSEISLSGTEFLSNILESTEEPKGVPGYLVECETPLGLVDDTCTTSAGTVALTNATGGGITTTFLTPSKAEQANCTQGGKEEGVVESLTNGPSLTALTDEEGLSITLGEG